MATRTAPARHPSRHPVAPTAKCEHIELRSGDSATSHNQLSVTSGDRLVQMRLLQADQPLLDGVWESQLTLGRAEIDPVGRWTSICSEVNDHAAYCELEMQLDGDVRIERQVFLARRDGFAYLADVVKCPRPGAGEYRMQLPLAANVTWQGDAESRDGSLVRGRGRVSRVIPLALPEWRAEPGGELTATGNRLELRLPLQGQRLHAALFLDLDRRRMRLPLTWRRLTVAEALTPVPRDLAVGYRVQVAKLQWLFYRSLGPCGNRSVLGQNFSTEFVAGRFPPTGIAEKMLEIE